MTWQTVVDQHPDGAKTGSADFWEGYLAENPDVLHRLLADVYTATYGAEHPPTLEDLWAIMATPKHTVEAFGPAVLDILNDRNLSIRWLAKQIGLVHTQLWRQLNGQRPIISLHDPKGSMSRIEEVARAFGLHPSYFVEWRRLWIMSLLDSAFAAKPDLSIGVFRRYAAFSPHENGR